MLTKPLVLFEWTYRKPLKPFGLDATVVDEAKFRRTSTILGWFFMAVGLCLVGLKMFNFIMTGF